MKLPQKLPGSFSLSKSKTDKNTPDDLSIAYSFDVHIEGLKFDMFGETKVQVR